VNFPVAVLLVRGHTDGDGSSMWAVALMLCLAGTAMLPQTAQTVGPGFLVGVTPTAIWALCRSFRIGNPVDITAVALLALVLALGLALPNIVRNPTTRFMPQQSRNALQTSVVAGAVAPFVLALIGALFSNTSNGFLGDPLTLRLSDPGVLIISVLLACAILGTGGQFRTGILAGWTASAICVLAAVLGEQQLGNPETLLAAGAVGVLATATALSYRQAGNAALH
jgi:hypothetical protein